MDGGSRFCASVGTVPKVQFRMLLVRVNPVYLLSASSDFDGWAKILHQYQLMSSSPVLNNFLQCHIVSRVAVQ